MREEFDRTNGSGGTFALGALAGALVGAGLGILFAPKTGSAMRGQISKRVSNMANQAQDAYREARAEVAPLVNEGRAAAEKWTGQGKEAFKDTYSEARDAAAHIVG